MLKTQDPAAYAIYTIIIKNGIPKKINEMENEFLDIIFQNPSYWKNESEAKNVYTYINNTINNFISQHNITILFAHPETFLQGPLELGSITAQSSLLKSKNETEKKESDIENRLKELETPLGKIPIDLNDAIMAYPFVSSVLFSICAHFLIGAIKIRKEFHLFYRYKNTKIYEITNEQIHNIAPI